MDYYLSSSLFHNDYLPTHDAVADMAAAANEGEIYPALRSEYMGMRKELSDFRQHQPQQPPEHLHKACMRECALGLGVGQCFQISRRLVDENARARSRHRFDDWQHATGPDFRVGDGQPACLAVVSKKNMAKLLFAVALLCIVAAAAALSAPRGAC